MILQEALNYLKASTQFEAVMFFQIQADRRDDLDQISAAAKSIGWQPEVDETSMSVRVFRPLTRAREA